MPLTRSQRVNRAVTTMKNNQTVDENQIQSSNMLNSITSALKRKADGRTVLGDLSSRNTGLTRKILGTKSSNTKNTIANSSNILGDKNSKNVSKQTVKNQISSINKGLSLKHDASSNVPIDAKVPKRLLESRNTLLQARLQKPVKQTEFKGHETFTLVPMDVWRLELKAQLIQRNVFYDIEKENANNHYESPDFSFGVFEYMKWREEQFEFKPYLDNYQTQISESDRRSFIDWMVEYQEIAEVNHETLYLAVRLCDYFFARQKISHAHLQLYGFVGYLLASKFEERWPPTFEDMIYISDDAYSRDDIIQAELSMLKTLEFDINIPHSYRYLRRYAKCCGMDMKCLTVARFYLELTLMEYEYVTESQSLLAAASLWITLLTLGYDVEQRTQTAPIRKYKKHWADILSYYTGHQEWEVIPLALRLLNTVRKVQMDCKSVRGDVADDPEVADHVLKVVYKKYASETFFEVAKFPVIDQETAVRHLRRAQSDKIDFEAQEEPSTKRVSNGCTSDLKKMTLRSSSPREGRRTPVEDTSDKENVGQEN